MTTSSHILVGLADFAGMEVLDYVVWTSKRGRDSEGTEETITDPEEVPAKRTRRGVKRLNKASAKIFIVRGVRLRARRDAKLCCKILTALGRREWKTWNDVPLELRKDIERIHRNLGHASADQLEKLFRDANVSDDAISAPKHFLVRCL